MTKRSFRGKPKKKKSADLGGPGMKNPQAMLSRVQQMQKEMESAQEALESESLTVTYGGGAISVTITGHQRVQAITVDPDVIDPEDMDMFQDMLVGAVNLAIEQSQKLSAERMESISGGLDLGSMMGGLGL